MGQFIRLASVSAFLALLLLGGCGNKGALYIPESPPQQQSTTTDPQ